LRFWKKGTRDPAKVRVENNNTCGGGGKTALFLSLRERETDLQIRGGGSSLFANGGAWKKGRGGACASYSSANTDRGSTTVSVCRKKRTVLFRKEHNHLRKGRKRAMGGGC